MAKKKKRKRRLWARLIQWGVGKYKKQTMKKRRDLATLATRAAERGLNLADLTEADKRALLSPGVEPLPRKRKKK